MKPQSAKQKGRLLQQDVAKRILNLHPSLTENDVKSTGMGQGGMDVQLSEAARELFPYAVECKSRKSMAIYNDFDQSVGNSDDLTPIIVVKANRKPPLVAMHVDEFFYLLEKANA